ncbi:MAG: hypothetical protein Q7W30_05035 [Coriobacteriia bacterium]|nr:hypothetical protein [Coriobacteriia bacterium]
MTTMTSRMKRLVLGAAATLLASALTVAPVYAATGNQGYAVYRDGVLWGYEWHAALMDDPRWNTTSLPIVHTPGSGYVKWDTWSNFLGGKTYMGTYRPKTAPSSASRDNFVYMMRKLKDEQILYSGLYQVEYNLLTAGTYVDPAEVTKMRCDGVVEYVYEWYGFRVFGDATHWDVTRAGFWYQDDHSGSAVTPKLQAQSYLTKVTSSLP